jgi:hypothetical protein
MLVTRPVKARPGAEVTPLTNLFAVVVDVIEEQGAGKLVVAPPVVILISYLPGDTSPNDGTPNGPTNTTLPLLKTVPAGFTISEKTSYLFAHCPPVNGGSPTSGPSHPLSSQ